MAYVTIITGTHQFTDPQYLFTAAYIDTRLYKYNIDGVKFSKRRFDRVVITEDEQVIFLPSIIGMAGGKWDVTQTMGSGKSIVGVEKLARTHLQGGRTGANLGMQWFPSNQGKLREDWRPNLNSLEDLENAYSITILFDDIKSTVKKWNCEEAQLISLLVNTFRKGADGKGPVNLIITTQRVYNFVPKDIREVATNYEIPIITIRDLRRKTPDGMGYPYEMEILNIAGNGAFIGFGTFNGWFPDGYILRPSERLLNAYNTMEKATKLGEKCDSKPLMQDTEKEPYNGYANEKKYFDELRNYRGVAQHIAAETQGRHHETDIIFQNGKTYYIDVVSLSKDRKYQRLNTAHKNLKRFQDTKDKKYLIGFFYKGDPAFLFVKDLQEVEGNVMISTKNRGKIKLLSNYFDKL